MQKILIVDDIEDYLFQLSSMLEDDYEILTAKNMEDAKNLIKDVQLAIIDIVLNEKEKNNTDGLKLLEWLKKNHPDIPVIIMSGYKEFSMAVNAINNGALYFLKKPYNEDTVKKIVKKYIN